jgi:hypothetical protein
MIFHYPFKTSEKSLYEAVEIIMSKFISPNLSKEGSTLNRMLKRSCFGGDSDWVKGYMTAEIIPHL